MKKSEMLYKTQLAVVKAISLTPEEKIEIVIMLEEQKKVEAFWENKREQEAAEKAAAEEKEAEW